MGGKYVSIKSINQLKNESFVQSAAIYFLHVKLVKGCVKGPDLWNMLLQCLMWAIAIRMKRRDLQHGIDIRYSPDGIIRKRSMAMRVFTKEGNVKDVSFADDAAVGLNNTGVYDEFYAASFTDEHTTERR